ncbi:water dikinase [Micractinium conductrix]|uniref:Water dikinase n=1 Tax=Micractinium conductrix TaxID=554055 RepID=A0A2P6V3W5_9CHLO|nr:water dikinase [Micractinium conductrix]|eukprot:PSC68783.1 water dikinase [Micractinium conductrix]
MQAMGAPPVLRDLVLVGGGHSHVTVLKQFAMRPMAGVRVTLITSQIHTPYSGMLPGFISGFYSFDDVHIDLARLARFAGARLVHAEARGLDTEARRVLLRDRPPLPYDVLSLNLGITPALSTVPGAAEHTTPVKPISGLVPRFEALLANAVAADAPLRVAVVGGGASGVELACALQCRLSRERQAVGFASQLTVALVSRGPILQGLTPYARRTFLPLLEERGVVLYESNGGVAEVQPGALVLADGQRVPFDECLWSTQASATGWLGDTGLPVDADGFLLVDECLRSAGGPPNVFAAGDVASCAAHPRPKAGVFAVRAGAPLAENLRRALAGEALQRWKPQATFLSLISAGDKYVVATKGWLGMQGGWLWSWKDRIDRSFMNKFGSDLDFEAMQQQQPAAQQQQLPQALAASLSAEELAVLAGAKMRCGGCGSKVGASSLARALRRLQQGEHGLEGDSVGLALEAAADAGVLLGLGQPDDAAVLEPPPAGHVTVHTVDFFRAMVTDPFVFGQIAANHALGDCFAMGATPTAALATAVVPFASPAVMEEDLHQMLAGALRTLRSARCALVGGHSSEGSELALGFSIYGSAPRDAILSKGGMQPGQALVLTKPIGTGTLLAAEMRGGGRGRWVEAAVGCMLRSSGPAVPVLRSHGATACTDVTGFGLLGHVVEMARASKVVVSLDAAAVPLLEGARECAAGGYLSSLHAENARAAAAVQGDAGACDAATLALLVDPQTAGGLLAAVPAGSAERCMADLRAAGFAHAAVVGSVMEPLQDATAPCLRQMLSRVMLRAGCLALRQGGALSRGIQVQTRCCAWTAAAQAPQPAFQRAAATAAAARSWQHRLRRCLASKAAAQDELEEGEEEDDDDDEGIDAVGNLRAPPEEEFEEFEDSIGPELSTGDVEWGEKALAVVQQLLADPAAAGGLQDIELFSFRAIPSSKRLDIRLDKMTDQYGSPSLDDVAEFSRAFNTAYEAALGEAAAGEIEVEVSSAGAERQVRVPGELQRFAELPMKVEYSLEEDKVDTKVLTFVEHEAASAVTRWRLADVRVNRSAAGKGRGLNKKQRESIVELPLAAVRRVNLHIDF